jgi:hypothetical protein
VRVQISIPDKVWGRLCDVARDERRLPKQQIEYLVIQTIAAAEAERAEATADSR